MAERTQAAMFKILKCIQSDVSDLKGRQDKQDLRMERIEDMIRKWRRDSAAMLVLMRGTVGVFDERMSDLEDDVKLINERG